MAAVDSARTVQATAKFVRISPRKARLVTDNIRGRSVPEARTILAFTERAAAVEVEKVLRSAVANAEANHGLLGDELVVSAAYADEGPTMKRWRPRARGRVARIHKRTCHITIELVPLGGGSLPAARNVPVPPAPAQEPITVGPEPEEPQVDSPEAEVAAEAPPEEKPKRRSRAKKTEETSAEAAPAEEKPKRTRKKKTEEKES
jgi:large subunit ribosomal protein L22